jgi:NADH:ubiquinone oxidoreductase subunit E
MTTKSNSQLLQQTNEINNTRHRIRICLGSSCFSKAKQSNLEYIELFLKQNKLIDEVDFAGHLCIDQCMVGPNVEIDGVMYNEVDSAKLEIVLHKHFGV